MTSINASKARSNLYNLIDEANESNEPIIISGKRNNAVLISEDNWNALQETLFLISIPDMRESIIKGMNEPLAHSVKKIAW